ncbi:hypothetical protein Ddye_028227 [Dipteronia dyeriana]|uniref:S-locus glycoprotein domain-containing protein n=1 Tax=Dipteronia dyeriana TaxID=168575 RepID=A0AAD9TQM1_9ROSI|nr:hypothetical protein Ddye_028227 [Dipteronia dyeriana]
MLVVYSILLFILGTFVVLDTIIPSQSIKDEETLESAGGTFELAFFSPGNSTRRYLGIRAGSWNGIRFTGTPRLNPNQGFLYRFELNKDEVYYEVDDQGPLISRLSIKQSGFIQHLVRSTQSKFWPTVYDAPEYQCEIYSVSGAHAACRSDSSSSVCACLDGFEPKSPEEWSMSNWSKGCLRMTELSCEKTMNSGTILG